jgi:formamidopyrimidine-DNA glycosylase
MPELPEVEFATRLLDRAIRDKRIVALRALHPSMRRSLGDGGERVRGRRVLTVSRRGKHQLVALDDGTSVHVHFRMTGDWAIGTTSDAERRHARAELDLDDGTRVSLLDSRALATLSVHPPGHSPLPELGPEALDPALDATVLAAALAGRRLAIKPALLDQRVVAGLGNIYAVEALWHARISPRAAAASLRADRLARLIAGMRRTLADATHDPGRYGRGEAAHRLHVYDRAGEPCERCGAVIRRIVQSGRSTYYCPRCQRR